MQRLFTLCLLVSGIIGCGRGEGQPQSRPEPAPAAPQSPAERSAEAARTAPAETRCKRPTDEEFAAVLAQSAQPVVVCFYSPAVAESTALLPIMERLAGQYADRVTAVLVDIDEAPLTTTRWRVDVAPTAIAFQDGHPIEIRTRNITQSDLEALFTLVTLR